MAESTRLMQKVVIDYTCDECGEGKMEYNPSLETVVYNPSLNTGYKHTCNI